jgi:hypothetical protein
MSLRAVTPPDDPVALLMALRATRRWGRLGLFTGQGERAPDFDQRPADLPVGFEGKGRVRVLLDTHVLL